MSTYALALLQTTGILNDTPQTLSVAFLGTWEVGQAIGADAFPERVFRTDHAGLGDYGWLYFHDRFFAFRILATLGS